MTVKEIIEELKLHHPDMVVLDCSLFEIIGFREQKLSKVGELTNYRLGKVNERVLITES
jgi:hypothetical protein